MARDGYFVNREDPSEVIANLENSRPSYHDENGLCWPVSARSLKAGGVEMKHRTRPEKTIVPSGEAGACIKSALETLR
jgi:hypothetical protein